MAARRRTSGDLAVISCWSGSDPAASWCWRSGDSSVVEERRSGSGGSREEQQRHEWREKKCNKIILTRCSSPFVSS